MRKEFFVEDFSFDCILTIPFHGNLTYSANIITFIIFLTGYNFTS